MFLITAPWQCMRLRRLKAKKESKSRLRESQMKEEVRTGEASGGE